MRRIPFISALVAVFAGLFGRRKSSVMTKRALQLSSPVDKPRNNVARHKRVKYQRVLRRKFARNNLLRHGFEVIGPGKAPKRPDPETRRLMRNARKAERAVTS